MRIRMNDIIHLNRSRRQMRQALKLNPTNTQLIEEIGEITDKLFNELVEIMIDLNRDVSYAKNTAQRAKRFPQ